MTRKKSKVPLVVDKTKFDRTLQAMISTKPLKLKDIKTGEAKVGKVIAPRT
jgi:hypothetical protein